jgi:predicted PurR-regulated permease PerM
VTKLGKLLPIKRGHQAELLSSFEEITSGVIKGQVIVALIQGALGALGFYFFGVKSPILWGVVMAIFAFIPIFGTAVVWFPAGTILVLTGLLSKNVLLVWKGMGLLVYGAVVVSSADNFLRPLVVGRKANVHPILVLLGVLGGLKAFGFIGFVIGPLILALLMTFIRIYQRQKNEIAG